MSQRVHPCLHTIQITQHSVCVVLGLDAVFPLVHLKDQKDRIEITGIIFGIYSTSK